MRLHLAVLALGTFALGTDVFVIAGILPSVAHSLGMPLTLAAQLVTVFALAYAIGSPVLATLTETIPRRALLGLSLVVFAVANLLAAMSIGYAEMLLARILAALAASVYTPAASAVAASLAPPERRGKALAFVMAGMTVATVIGVPLGTLIGIDLGWRWTFALIAGLSLIAAVGGTVLLPSSLPIPPRIGLRMRLTLLHRVDVLMTLAVTLCWTVGGFTVYTYMAPLLERIGHYNGAIVAMMLLMYGIASLPGNLIGGYGTDRFGSMPTIGFGLAVVAVVLLLFPLLLSSVIGTVIGIGLWGLSGWILIAPQQHRLLALTPDMPRVVLSLNGSAIYLGIGGGAVMGALTLRYLGLPALGITGSVWEIAALILLIWSSRFKQSGMDVANSVHPTNG